MTPTLARINKLFTRGVCMSLQFGKSVLRCSAFLAALMCFVLSINVSADHSSEPVGVALVGDLQSELGCPGDWQPDCASSELIANGTQWQATFLIPTGDWQFKVALNDTWDESYGDSSGANLNLSLAQPTEVTFIYDAESHVVSNTAPLAQPNSVTVAGNLQSELGCPGDWQPDCETTFLSYDADDGVWQGVFDVPTGNWEYKAPLNGSWDVNYGQNATQGGNNIPLNLDVDTSVKFYYDHATNWITDNQNSVIATVAGNFQTALGCPDNWQPWCLQSWLQDTDSDGIYTFSTRDIPVGNYESKVAHNEAWDENYGEGGEPNGNNIAFTVPEDGALVVFTYNPTSHVLEIGGELPKGDIKEARAYWLTKDSIAWDVPGDSLVSLHYSTAASLSLGSDGVQGGTVLELIQDGVVDGASAEKFRHLTGLPIYKIAASDLGLVTEILQSQFVVAAVDAEDKPVDATAVQAAGVLDDLYSYQGDLGVSYNEDTPTITVWAPTARSVSLKLFDDADQGKPASASIAMLKNANNGTWSVQGSADWDRKYYLYEVEVFARSEGQVVTNLVTDPYSHSLSQDSLRTQIVNLTDRDLKPRHWDRLRKPRLSAPEDMAIYELHVRDFSISDETVPENLRGTYKAFSLNNSAGKKHLRKLSWAGMTHVHLLPAFDCATIPEDRSTHATPGDLSSFAPDSEDQQAAIGSISDQDGFNWCYDPFHFTTPEGSYATDANGVTRVKEFRDMVEGLNKSGMRVVMDVVYNHTSGSLQGGKSVLDKIVPDYYHRLNNAGYIEKSSCCANTATEHNMMEKLMLDSLRTWAVEYKVDGFRFDLMGHHTRANIEKARDMLNALNVKDHGVDGSKIYLYGEGWNFGEVANDARFLQATQINMGDQTGVGSFNDRIRDGVRGGGPFDSGIDHVRRQGFINGLYTDPNAENSATISEKEELLRLTDWIRVGLSGSLSDYQFEDRFGNIVSGKEVDYPGQGGAGYTSDPQEIINYAAAHDNETLFDVNQYKLPRATSKSDRVRVQGLANSILALSQGIPLFHAGQDILRSKSMDRNSYNSGDWFNELDLSYQSNGWGKGLPPEEDNGANWDEQRDLLSDVTLGDIDRRDIRKANRQLREMLWIRKTSRLFRLRTAEDIIERLNFHNTGPDQTPGLIVMSLKAHDGIEKVVVFNASTEDQFFDFSEQASADDSDFMLHPVQRFSRDGVTRRASWQKDGFFVPARTTAVFIKDRWKWRWWY